MRTNSPGTTPSSTRHVMVRLGERAFGIPAELVAEMVQLGPVTQLPQSRPTMRGVMLVRGEGLAVHDLRTLLSIPSLQQELGDFRAMLEAREQDHRRWLEELERCVTEGRAFTLATDPHKCAFGRWYDGFQTTNILLESHLRRFDAPHQRIHALAKEVDAMVRAGDASGAMARIAATRARELAEMLLLFRQLYDLLESSTHEIVVVLRAPSGARIGYTVDSVESVQEVTVEAVQGDAELSARRCAFYGQKREIASLFSASDLLEAA